MRKNTLIENIVKCLKDREKAFIGSLKNNETVAESKGYKEGLLEAIEIIETLERQAEFEEIAILMIKHLCERTDLYHPHYTVIITPTNAELLQGKKSTGYICDFIQD